MRGGVYTNTHSCFTLNYSTRLCFAVLYTEDPSTLLRRIGLISFCTLLPISFFLDCQGAVHVRLASALGNRRLAFALGTNLSSGRFSEPFTVPGYENSWISHHASCGELKNCFRSSRLRDHLQECCDKPSVCWILGYNSWCCVLSADEEWVGRKARRAHFVEPASLHEAEKLTM